MNQEELSIEERHCDSLNLKEYIEKMGNYLKNDLKLHDPYSNALKSKLLQVLKKVHKDLGPYHKYLTDLENEYWAAQSEYDKKLLAELNSREYKPTN